MLKYLETIDTTNYEKLKAGDILQVTTGRSNSGLGYMLIVDCVNAPCVLATWLVCTNGNRAGDNSGVFSTTLARVTPLGYIDKYFSKAVRMHNSFIATTSVGVVCVDLIQDPNGGLLTSKHRWLT